MISVVIPVFNVEKYLQECVDSVIAQTYKDIEIILVDDGSTDKSGVLCDDYKEKDDRIIVVHKANGGLSDARNYGMDIAKGEIISFIDSDDYLAPDFLSIMYKAIVDGDCDIVALKKACEFWDGEECIGLSNTCHDIRYCSTVEAVNQMFYMHIETGAQFKLYRKSILKEIRFPYGYYYEDVATTYKAFFAGKKAAIVDADIYAYRKRKDSILRQEFSYKKLSALEIFDDILNDKSIKEAKLEQAAKARAYPMLFSVFLQIPIHEKKLRKEAWRKLQTVRRDVLFDNSGLMRRKNKIAAFVSLLGMNMAYYIGRKFGQKNTMGNNT